MTPIPLPTPHYEAPCINGRIERTLERIRPSLTGKSDVQIIQSLSREAHVGLCKAFRFYEQYPYKIDKPIDNYKYEPRKQGRW